MLALDLAHIIHGEKDWAVRRRAPSTLRAKDRTAAKWVIILRIAVSEERFDLHGLGFLKRLARVVRDNAVKHPDDKRSAKVTICKVLGIVEVSLVVAKGDLNGNGAQLLDAPQHVEGLQHRLAHAFGSSTTWKNSSEARVAIGINRDKPFFEHSHRIATPIKWDLVDGE